MLRNLVGETGKLRRRWEDNIRYKRNRMWGYGLVSSGSAQGSVATLVNIKDTRLD
jgi:hypothetical protein